MKKYLITVLLITLYFQGIVFRQMNSFTFGEHKVKPGEKLPFRFL